MQRFEIVNGVAEAEGVAKEPATDEGADKAAEGTLLNYSVRF